jgi:hypothetical protein
MQLTSAHIEFIRQYCLASTTTEQTAIQQQADPLLSGFLPLLKERFNDADGNEGAVMALAKQIGVADQWELLVGLQEEYYEHLAALYNAGSINSDIKILLQSGNPVFLAEINFQQELATAFLLEERALLKKRFRELDNESDEQQGINDEEIALAFKLEEREKLKQQFREIDTQWPVADKQTAPVIAFNWRRLAVASIMVGVVASLLFVFFRKSNYHRDIASDTENKKKHADSLFHRGLLEKKMQELLASNKTMQRDSQLIVLKEPASGFLPEEEKISLHIYDVKIAMEKIKAETPPDADSLSGFADLLSSLQLKIDSLANLEKKYSFSNGNLTAYMQVRDVKLLKIGSIYYLQADGILYECMQTTALRLLKPVTNNATKEKTKMILLIHSKKK